MELKLEEEVTINPETGFPELPEGAYWQVSDYGYRSFYVDLKVLVPNTSTKPYLLFWSKEHTVHLPESVDSKGVYLDELEESGNLTKETIREALVEAAIAVYNRTLASSQRKAMLESFIGKYPPKNLNQL